MSTVPGNNNVACCTITPVKSDHKSTGSFNPYADFNRVYTTGQSSEKAIICVYDIFGFWEQTQIGADRLAESLKAKVFMPDFFGDKGPYPAERFPPSTDEDKAKLGGYFQIVDSSKDNLVNFAIKLKGEGFKQVAVYGFCWGGKVVMKAGQSDVFDAIAVVHPAALDAKDAETLRSPLGLFPSGDESKDESDKVFDIVSKNSYGTKNAYKYYSSMFHGWAAARAKLDDAENLKQFNDLYSTLAGYFSNIIGKA